MSFVPEPWKHEGKEDMEIAEELSALEALDPPHGSQGSARTSFLRRYWEKLLTNKHR
ncbi:MAG: hypothetical protein KGZ54_00405 [Dethiobacter sp.]|jgi:hypothetical protein|nr:hypothetical protein [Dethiobacter sp.]MBS3988586.1 hypothetical protein [Dethiobacter sp.]